MAGKKRNWDWTSIYSSSEKLLLDSSEDSETCNNAIEKIDLRFARRIMRLIAEQAVVQYQLAYLSTLGGAYHLCNRPHVALAIAIRQENVGRRMGSFTIVIRAKVFQAVNMRLLGQKDVSDRLMKDAYSLLDQSGLENIRSFVVASHKWLERNYGNIEEEKAEMLEDKTSKSS